MIRIFNHLSKWLYHKHINRQTIRELSFEVQR